MSDQDGGRPTLKPEGHIRATWRKLGQLPDEDLSAAITRAREEQDDAVTTATVLRYALGVAPPEEDTPELPEDVYRTIVIDPPWPMPKITRRTHAEQGSHLSYAVMSLEDIAALDIPAMVDPEGAHIYLWVTQKYLPAGLDILAGWGARYECQLTWVKPTGITPYSWMYNTEHVLFARAGRALDVQRKGLKLGFQADAAGHSIKPDAFYELVRQASPEPRLEMFTRQPHQGFDAWGAQVAA